jgi:AcrR family transcriptional regulator
MVNRTNYWRHTTAVRGLSDEVILDTLATVIQLALFPSTPAEALVVPRTTGSADGRWESSADRRGPNRREGEAGGQPRTDRFAGVSDRVQGTIGRLLDAGAEVFSAKGYHSASVDDIVSEAGLGRGTFYKYFNDKLDLLIVLADECVQRVQGLASSFGEIRPDRQGSGVALRAWLEQLLCFHWRYTGVFQVWQARNPSDASLYAMGQETASAMLAAFDKVLGQVKRDHPFSVPAGSLILLALVDDFPDQALLISGQADNGQLPELLATVIERGMLNRPNRGRLAALA